MRHRHIASGMRACRRHKRRCPSPCAQKRRSLCTFIFPPSDIAGAASASPLAADWGADMPNISIGSARFSAKGQPATPIIYLHRREASPSRRPFPHAPRNSHDDAAAGCCCRFIVAAITPRRAMKMPMKRARRAPRECSGFRARCCCNVEPPGHANGQ